MKETGRQMEKVSLTFLPAALCVVNHQVMMRWRGTQTNIWPPRTCGSWGTTRSHRRATWASASERGHRGKTHHALQPSLTLLRLYLCHIKFEAFTWITVNKGLSQLELHFRLDFAGICPCCFTAQIDIPLRHRTGRQLLFFHSKQSLSERLILKKISPLTC